MKALSYQMEDDYSHPVKKIKSSNLTTYHSNGKVVKLWVNKNFKIQLVSDLPMF